MYNQSDESVSNHALTSWIYQDGLKWSRLQTIGIIQIGTLSAAYATKAQVWWFKGSIILFGIFLTLLAFDLLFADHATCRYLNDQYRLHPFLGGPAKEKKLLKIFVIYPWPAPLSGRYVAIIFFWLLMAADVLLFIYLLRFPQECG